MPGFGLLERLMGSVNGRIQEAREFYNQAQLEILQAQERNYMNEYESLSMSSTSSYAWRDKPKRHKRKIKVVKPKEFFKKEEFDI